MWGGIHTQISNIYSTHVPGVPARLFPIKPQQKQYIYYKELMLSPIRKTYNSTS